MTNELGIDDAIVELLGSQSRLMTAGAISLLLARDARGPLGTEPCEEVATALVALSAAGRVACLPACPGCGLAGEVWTLPERIGPADRPAAPLGQREIQDAIAPLIAEGLVEVGERVELVDSTCCMRSARPWRPTPRPA
jgi:hypothetical protein